MAQLTLEKNQRGQVVYLHGNLSLNVFGLKMETLEHQFQQVEVYRNFCFRKKQDELAAVKFAAGLLQNSVTPLK